MTALPSAARRATWIAIERIACERSRDAAACGPATTACALPPSASARCAPRRRLRATAARRAVLVLDESDDVVIHSSFFSFRKSTINVRAFGPVGGRYDTAFLARRRRCERQDFGARAVAADGGQLELGKRERRDRPFSSRP